MRSSFAFPFSSTSRLLLHRVAAVTPSTLLSRGSGRGCLHATLGRTLLGAPQPLEHAHQQASLYPMQARRQSVIPSAASTASPSDLPNNGPLDALLHQYSKFSLLVGKFMPMVGLFFLLAFVNTILDSLKDTLVITAVGGGAQVIPYLTVYAVLPSSIVFLLLYSYASQRWSRSRLFNGIILVFVSFFACFAFAMYPNQDTLHPHELAEKLSKIVPSGLEGAVGMIRNWTFTLFFCMSELWGDVCLGLLFWGLANDTTTLQDAPTLYPLFGLGANIAQAIAGLVLKRCSEGGVDGDFAAEIKYLMVIVLIVSFLAMALHSYINKKAAKDKELRVARRLRRAERAELNAALLAKARAKAMCDLTGDPMACAVAAEATVELPMRPIKLPHAYDSVPSDDEDAQRISQPTSTSMPSTSLPSEPSADNMQEAAQLLMYSDPSSSDSSDNSFKGGISNARVNAADDYSLVSIADGTIEEDDKPRASILAIFKVLAASVPIRCLATMSLAQGLCSSLMEFAWKTHIRMMYPTPGEFTAFLGDVSTCQGVMTGLLMFLSPAMFERLGWKGVAGTSPYVLMWGGSAFFCVCILYQYLLSSGGSGLLAHLSAGAGAGVVVPLLLNVLVFGGAALYVFSKSAKFSLFKPAEEMVYISMDEEGRTKGKAAIDVVGSQAGKSGGSMLQQLLLLFSGGAIAGSFPIMFAVFIAMAQAWINSVGTLADHADYGHSSTVHPSANDNHDSDDEGGREGGDGTEKRDN